MGDDVALEALGQRSRESQFGFADVDDGGAGQWGGVELERRHVEVERRYARQAGRGIHPMPSDRLLGVGHGAAMGVQDAFRATGRAGGEDQIRRRSRVDGRPFLARPMAYLERVAQRRERKGGRGVASQPSAGEPGERLLVADDRGSGRSDRGLPRCRPPFRAGRAERRWRRAESPRAWPRTNAGTWDGVWRLGRQVLRRHRRVARRSQRSAPRPRAKARRFRMT